MCMQWSKGSQKRGLKRCIALEIKGQSICCSFCFAWEEKEQAVGVQPENEWLHEEKQMKK